MSQSSPLFNRWLSQVGPDVAIEVLTDLLDAVIAKQGRPEAVTRKRLRVQVQAHRLGVRRDDWRCAGGSTRRGLRGDHRAALVSGRLHEP